MNAEERAERGTVGRVAFETTTKAKPDAVRVRIVFPTLPFGDVFLDPVLPPAPRAT